jgi:hypothetical protein
VRDDSQTPPDTPRLLYDRKTAAKRLSVSLRTIDLYLSRREFDTRRIGRRVLITHASLVRFASRDHFNDSTASRSEDLSR